MTALHLQAQSWTEGRAAGELLWSDTPLSFWGGIDPATGTVIDQHHPLCGQSVRDRVLALPSGRGSCTGSSVMLELLLSGNAPRALVLAGVDDILLLGVLVAQRMFGRSIPVLSLSPQDYAALEGAATVHVGPDAGDAPGASLITRTAAVPPLALTARDQALLAGAEGRARQVAMEIIVRMAGVAGAPRLIDIRQVHVDGCIYTGDACLRFAQQLVDWQGRVAVPTSLNAISVDRCGWRGQGVAPAFGEPAEALAQAYVDLGAAPTYTCAPYLLNGAPRLGEQIAWAESNAVIYANSVIGARTAKYPDFLDILMALTGRAPEAGCHLDQGRKAAMRIAVDLPEGFDDSLYPLLGYQAGLQSGREIPLLAGMESTRPVADDLRAFGAAFATSSAAPMFHIAGITPEARDAQAVMAAGLAIPTQRIDRAALLNAWHELNPARTRQVELVALGNPHFSIREIVWLAALCAGRTRHADTDVVVTTSRFVLDSPEAAGSVAALRAFGVRFVVDTCWCMVQEPVIAPRVRTVMTNSGKYAHYAPGLTGRQTRFGSLADCVDAACTGQAPEGPPDWLR
ncbi:cis-3-hydroxy-L-proline dehydratase [Xylophilus rhododendri]|nr:aconitase family protein [Xylophilus rhododendri]